MLAWAGVSESPLEMANRGVRLYAAANYPEAEALYRRALDEWPREAAAIHGRAIVLSNLGILLGDTGRYTEAVAALHEALGQLEAVGPVARREMAAALDDLAVIYRTRGDLAQAESYALRAAEIVDDAERPANRLVLATIYAGQGRFSEAEPLLLTLAASADAHTAITAHIILASAAIEQGKFVEGAEHARQALELAGRALPENHPAIAMALNDLAQACRAQGQYLEAEKRYREAIAIWETTFGPDHPDLAKGLLGLAGLYHERQRDAGAETLYRRAIRILERAFGDDAPQVLSARSEPASVLRSQRRVTEAESLMRGAR